MMQEAPRIRVPLLSLSVVLLLLFATPPRSDAQTASESQIKAAYLYNFAKFVEWPASVFPNAATPIRVCVLNDRSFETELNQVVSGKSIAGRPVIVVPVQNGEQSRGCQVLFGSSSQARQVRHVMAALRDTSVLTVGETNGFVQEGGIINFVVQDNRVQFQVNRKAANQAGLRISSRLLSLAKLVIE